jgi:hypothetical protein
LSSCFLLSVSFHRGSPYSCIIRGMNRWSQFKDFVSSYRNEQQQYEHLVCLVCPSTAFCH